jgi:anti-sigma B factor antagonist
VHETVRNRRIEVGKMQAELNVIEHAETHTIIALKGSMDVVGAGAIENRFLGHTAARKLHSLVDMTGVDFLGSMGIRVFVSAAKALLREQKKLVLFGAQPSIEKTLTMSGFTSVVPVVPTLESAKAKIGL